MQLKSAQLFIYTVLQCPAYPARWLVLQPVLLAAASAMEVQNIVPSLLLLNWELKIF